MSAKCNRGAFSPLRCLFSIIALALPLFAWGQTGAPEEIEFGYVEMPPRTFTNAQGKPDGQLVRLMTTVLAKAGVPWRARSYPATRLFSNLRDGSTPISILVRVPSLEECCLFSKEAVGVAELRVYHIGKKPPIKRRDDLAGKSLIVLRGYSYSGLINYLNDPKSQIATEVAATHEAAFDMLSAGRADFLIDYSEPSEIALAANPIGDVHFDVLERSDRVIVMSKSYPNAPKVMERLDAILKSMDKEQFFRDK